MKNLGFIFTFLLSSQTLFAQSDLGVTEYKIKSGDTLSQVLEDHGIRGIYVHMKKDRHLNPMFIIAKKNGFSWESMNTLPVGKIIYLPVKSSEARTLASQEEFVIEDISDSEFRKIVDEYIKEND